MTEPQSFLYQPFAFQYAGQRINFLGMCTDHHISAVMYQDPRRNNVVLDSKLVTISVYKNGGQKENPHLEHGTMLYAIFSCSSTRMWLCNCVWHISRGNLLSCPAQCSPVYTPLGPLQDGCLG